MWVAASDFMYDNCRVNIGDEHGDKILEYDIEKTICMFFLMLYLNLLSKFTTLRLVGSQLLTDSKIDSQFVGSKLRNP